MSRTASTPAIILIVTLGLIVAARAQPAGAASAGPEPRLAPAPAEPQPAPATPAPSSASPPAANRIEAPILNLRRRKGEVRCALFASADGFPDDSDKAIAGADVPATREHPACIFPNLPPGRYAIAVLADENENGRMDFNLLWLPVEGYGFSNDAMGIFGSPSFKAAQFYHRGRITIVPIRLRY